MMVQIKMISAQNLLSFCVFVGLSQYVMSGHSDVRKALFSALISNNTEEVKNVVLRAKIEGIDNLIKLEDDQLERPKPLHVAAEKNNVATAEFILSEGADINSLCHVKESNNDFFHNATILKCYLTPLQMAVKHDSKEVVRFLLENNAPTSLPNLKRFWKGALHYAAENDNVDIAKLILKAGGEVDEKDSSSFTSLYYAIKKGNVRMVGFLLYSGADASNVNDVLRYNGLHALTKADKNQDKIVRLLLGKGVNLEQKSADWETPLELAIRSFSNSTDVLINFGAKIKEHIIFRAFNKSFDEFAKFLITSGALFCNTFELIERWNSTDSLRFRNYMENYPEDVTEVVNCHSKDGDTPLHMAVQVNNEEWVKLLLGKGAGVSITDSQNIPPIFYSLKNKACSITKLLLGHSSGNVNDNEIKIGGLSEAYQQPEIKKALQKMIAKKCPDIHY